MMNSMILNQMADSYWQHYQQNHPIGGGDIAYEHQLRHCNLNLSLGSLKELDRMLTHIRKEVQAQVSNMDNKPSVEQQKRLLLQKKPFKKLLLFIGFYTARVLAKIYKSQMVYFSQKELVQVDASFGSAEFEHSLAIRFVDANKQQHLQSAKVAEVNQPWLFFVLEPIIMRLFGGFDYQVRSLQHQPMVADGLYRAVLERLPEQLRQQVHHQYPSQGQPKSSLNQSFVNKPSVNQSFVNSSPTNNPAQTSEIQHRSNPQQRQPTAVNQMTLAEPIPAQQAPKVSKFPSQPASNPQLVNQSTVTQSTVTQSIVPQSSSAMPSPPDTQQTQVSPSTEASLAKTNTSSSVNTNNTSIRKVTTNTNDINVSNASSVASVDQPYLDVLTELEDFPVEQLQGEQAYQRGKKVMEQFDKHAHQQQKPTSELVFSDKYIQARKQALSLINQAAQAGNTTAMLHLAVYYLRGDWLAKNQPKAVNFVQTAANAQDPRAMRLLSKLYYQGDGVQLDTNLGKYWLQQAASGGHPEADKLMKQIQLAQLMMDDHKADQASDKRYVYAIASILFVALLILLFV